MQVVVRFHSVGLRFLRFCIVNFGKQYNFVMERFAILFSSHLDWTWIQPVFPRLFQPLVAPSSHPMAPPSPSTNSSTNNSSSSSTAGWDQLSKTNLYIRGLSPSTTDHDLVKLCQPWVPHFLSSLSPIDHLLIFWPTFRGLESSLKLLLRLLSRHG